ncbi:MAG: hypothetical protein HeimC3_54630 [Candidatus Heimdallarchaeota archaeon LC_3]|nr:MAG: hypothetical protein HeimC3_54630 [Candidatus Heimdallarchaeota archaeon LC_3]
MRTYLKLYGPDLLKALPILEEISTKFSELSGSASLREDKSSKKVARIKSSSVVIGNYDFSFDWHTEPTIDRVLNLIKEIDLKLLKTKVRYEASTIKIGEEEQEKLIETGYSVSYVKFTGPGIYYALEKMISIDLPQIDTHGLVLSQFDYFFSWNKTPSNEEIMKLIKLIEELLYQIENFKVLYNVTTKDSKKEKKKVKVLDLKYLKVKYDRSGTYQIDKARFDLRRMT